MPDCLAKMRRIARRSDDCNARALWIWGDAAALPGVINEN